MYLIVSLDGVPPRVVLRDEGDFTAFKVVVDGVGDWADLSDAVAGRARVEPPHLWVDAGEVRALGRPEDPEWCRQLDQMVDFARSKGWLDQDGAIRAHCEWASGSPADGGP